MKKIHINGPVKGACATVIAASSLMLGHAQTSVVFNSINNHPGNFSTVYQTTLGNGSYAQGFTVGASSQVLFSVTLDMDAYYGGGNFQVAIYDASGAGGTPGLEVASLTGSSDPAAAGEYSYTPGSSFTLAAETSYYVVAEDAGAVSLPDSNEGYGWSLGRATEGTAVGRASDLDGGGWTSPDNYFALGMEVVGASPEPAPEPGTLALAGLGMAGLAAFRRKAGK